MHYNLKMEGQSTQHIKLQWCQIKKLYSINTAHLLQPEKEEGESDYNIYQHIMQRNYGLAFLW